MENSTEYREQSTTRETVPKYTVGMNEYGYTLQAVKRTLLTNYCR